MGQQAAVDVAERRRDSLDEGLSAVCSSMGRSYRENKSRISTRSPAVSFSSIHLRKVWRKRNGFHSGIVRMPACITWIIGSLGKTDRWQDKGRSRSSAALAEPDVSRLLFPKRSENSTSSGSGSEIEIAVVPVGGKVRHGLGEIRETTVLTMVVGGRREIHHDRPLGFQSQTFMTPPVFLLSWSRYGTEARTSFDVEERSFTKCIERDPDQHF